jgi:hypothetical protein
VQPLAKLKIEPARKVPKSVFHTDEEVMKMALLAVTEVAVLKWTVLPATVKSKKDHA